MAALPDWVEKAIRAHGVRVTRFGRNKVGRPSKRDQRWLQFCGHYHWHESAGKVRAFEGPFPCWSAAAEHAAIMHGLAERDTRTGQLRPIGRARHLRLVA